MGILEKIAEIEKEIARTQKNKGKNEQKRNVPPRDLLTSRFCLKKHRIVGTDVAMQSVPVM